MSLCVGRGDVLRVKVERVPKLLNMPDDNEHKSILINAQTIIDLLGELLIPRQYLKGVPNLPRPWAAFFIVE